MKKWLVGLMAAGLCAASAWANTVDELTNDDVGHQSNTYKDWTATGDSGAVYAGMTAGGSSTNPCIQLRSKNNNSGIVTTESGGNATKVTLVWNDATTAGRKVAIYGSAEAYSAPSDLYDASSQGTKLGELEVGSTELAIEGGYPFIGLRSTDSALFLDKIEIEWAGGTPPAFSIKLDPADDFSVVQDKSASITATVKGAQGDVSYSWSVDGSPINLAGNVYEIDSSVVGGPYEVTCEASDGVSDPVSASVSYTVVEAPVVSGDVLTRDTTKVTGNQYKDWTATGDSGTVYVGNSAGGNESIQLNTGSPKGIVITESAGSDVASVTVVWNDSTADKRSIDIYGSAEAYASPADLYGDAKGTLIGTIAKGETTLAVPEGYPYVGILAKGGALYLTSVAIEFAGAAGPSVSLSATATEVEIDEPVTVTATAKNFSADVEWSWTGNGTADGATFTVDTSVAGAYEITATATAGEETASKSVTITVSEPAPKFTVSVNDGILNGTIELSVDDGEVVPGPIEVAAGATVKVVATPESGFKLASLGVETEGGQPVELSKSNTFEMPADNVWVSAAFEEKPAVAGFTKITSLDELTEGEYVITGAKAGESEYAMLADIAGTSTKYIPRRDTAVEIEDDVVTDAEDSIIWTLAQGENGWTIYNAAETAGYVGFVASGKNSAGYETEPSEKSSWTISVAEGGLFAIVNVADSTRNLRYNTSSGQERFACYAPNTSGSLTGVALALYKGESGPAKPSVSLSATATEVEVDEPVTITATAKNFSADVEWSWTGNGTADGATFTVDTSAAGAYEITATATVGEETASKSVTITVSEPAVPHDVKIVVGMQGGVVTAEPEKATVGEKVTLTAKPEEGKKLEAMTVTYGEEESKTTLTFTSSPAEFEMPDEDVYVGATFVEKPVVAGFTKITSLDELTEGEYVITGAKAGESEYAMLAEIAGSSTKYIPRRDTAVEIEDDVVTDAEDSIIWTLAQGENGWTIYNAAETAGYVGYVASGKNSAGYEAEPSEKSSWTISVAEGGLFAVVNVADATRNLRYNTSSGQERFACYAPNTSGNLTGVALAFYKGESGPVAFSISLDPAEDFEVQQGQDAAITAKVRGAQGDVTYSWSVDGNPINLSGNVFAIDSSAIGGPHEVVCEASDGVSEPVSASVSYTVVEVPPVTGDEFTLITSIDGLQDGTLVVLTDPDGTLALSAKVESSVFAPTAVEPIGDVITTDNANIIWKLVDDGSGNFSLYNEVAGKYAGHAGGGTSNSGRLQDDPFPNAFSVEDNLFVIAATTADSAGNYRDLQFNQNGTNPRFAYYKGTQKDLRIYAAASGPAAPKITFEGETTKKVGETFELQFTLKNYDGSFTWVNDGREGGSIDEATGLYTWTPIEEGEVTITVKAMDGDTEIASKQVVLTVEKGEEPPPSATLTCEPSSVTMAVGGSAVVTLTVTGTEQTVGYIYFEGYEDMYAEENPATIDLADLELAEGTYTLVALATDSENNELARTELPVTVTGEGPQPGGEEIAEFSVDSKGGTLGFKEPSGAYTVESTKDLVNGPWEATTVTVENDRVIIPMEDGPRYYRVAQ